MQTRADDVAFLRENRIPPDADDRTSRWALCMHIGLRINRARDEGRDCPELIEAHNRLRREFVRGKGADCEGWRIWADERQEERDADFLRNGRWDYMEQEPTCTDLGA